MSLQRRRARLGWRTQQPKAVATQPATDTSSASVAGCKSQQPAGCLRVGRRLGRTDRFKKKTTRELGGRPALSAPPIHRSADLIPPIPPTRGRMMTPPLTHAAHGSLPLLSGTGTLCAKKICWARGQYRRAAEAWVHVQCASAWCGIWGGERQTADQGGGKRAGGMVLFHAYLRGPWVVAVCAEGGGGFPLRTSRLPD